MIQTQTIAMLLLIAIASVGLIGTAQQKVLAFGSNNVGTIKDHNHENGPPTNPTANSGVVANGGTSSGNTHENVNCNYNRTPVCNVNIH
jgi:hypothetical protein